MICGGQWAWEGAATGQELNAAWPEAADRGRGVVTGGTRGRCGEQVALEGLQGQRHRGRHRQNPPHFRLSILSRFAEGQGCSFLVPAGRHTTIFAVCKPAVFPGSVQNKSLRQP